MDIIREIPELEKQLSDFTNILSDEKIIEVAKTCKVIDQRRRLVPIECFFWLTVLSNVQSAFRGCLMNLVSFFCTAFVCLFPSREIITVSRMALSKKMKNVKWMFFKEIFNQLLKNYLNILDSKTRLFFEKFADCIAVDSTIIKLNKILEKIFKSIHKGKSALKMHTAFSIKNLIVTKVSITKERVNDRKFNFISRTQNVLYLFDLGYFASWIFEKIIEAKSHFVSRLKSNSDPLILMVKDKKFSHFVGKRFSQIKQLIKGESIDLVVQLGKSEKSKMKHKVRLVGLFFENNWFFYITNVFDKSFSCQVIYELYTKRWTIEIFFNDIKNILKLEHIASKTPNGIKIEIYSALIFYLLTKIVIALASKASGIKIEKFSFKRTFDVVRTFLIKQTSLVIKNIKTNLFSFFYKLVNLVIRLGLKDKIMEFA